MIPTQITLHVCAIDNMDFLETEKIEENSSWQSIVDIEHDTMLAIDTTPYYH